MYYVNEFIWNAFSKSLSRCVWNMAAGGWKIIYLLMVMSEDIMHGETERFRKLVHSNIGLKRESFLYLSDTQVLKLGIRQKLIGVPQMTTNGYPKLQQPKSPPGDILMTQIWDSFYIYYWNHLFHINICSSFPEGSQKLPLGDDDSIGKVFTSDTRIRTMFSCRNRSLDTQ